jgi:hypothetical protein
VKLRSRIAAVAAAAGLVGGVMVLGTGPAQAQDNILLECDHVGGSATIKNKLDLTGLEVEAKVVDIATKAPLVASPDPLKKFVPIAKPGGLDCTGLLATDNQGGGSDNDDLGHPDDVGDLVKISGKLTGSGTCYLVDDPPPPPEAETDPLDPIDGKLTFIYENIDPLTTKAWSSQVHFRISAGANDPVLYPDELVITAGIGIKGPGIGADVFGSFIFAPYDAKTKIDPDGAGPLKPAVPQNQSHINAAGDLVADLHSLTIGQNCINGGAPLNTAFFATDGTNLLFQPFNSSIGMSLPVPE